MIQCRLNNEHLSNITNTGLSFALQTGKTTRCCSTFFQILIRCNEYLWPGHWHCTIFITYFNIAILSIFD